MWANGYWGGRYWAPRYWAKVGEDPPIPAAIESRMGVFPPASLTNASGVFPGGWYSVLAVIIGAGGSR